MSFRKAFVGQQVEIDTPNSSYNGDVGTIAEIIEDGTVFVVNLDGVGKVTFEAGELCFYQTTRPRGFTIIEAMIVMAILAILAAIVAPALMEMSQGHNSSISWGYNGVVETRCIEGFKVLVSNGGRYNGTQLQQILDQNGHAIPCKVN